MNQTSLIKNRKSIFSNIILLLSNEVKKIDWVLLILIILVFNVSIKYKIISLFLTFLITFRRKIPFKEIPIFYYGIVILSTFHLIIGYLFNDDKSYFLISLIGIFYWVIMLIYSLQIKSIVNKLTVHKIKNTLALLFILNFIFCIKDIIYICIETSALNPYMFMGFSEKYFMSTGDYIYGIFGNASAVNAAACLLGVIFFLKENKFIAVIALISLLLTVSNLTNLILISLLLLIVIASYQKVEKVFALCLIAIMISFYVKISPDNLAYILPIQKNKIVNVDTLEKIKIKQTLELENYRDSILNKKNDLNVQPKVNADLSDKNQATQQLTNIDVGETDKNDFNAQPEVSADTSENMTKKNTVSPNRILSQQLNQAKMKLEKTKADTSYFIAIEKKQQKLSDKLNQINNNEELDKYPGKLTSYIKTSQFFVSGVKEFLIGAGTANYSSKLAFDVSGIGEGGEIMKKFNYSSPHFEQDHLKIYTYYFSQTIDKHSVTNSPFSDYNQIVGEYGLIGVLLFFFGYIVFFLKKFKRLTYGKYLIIALCMLFTTSYWFESITIVILFELMMFTDLKNKNEKFDS